MSSQTSAPRSSVSCNLACLLPDKKSLVDFFFFEMHQGLFEENYVLSAWTVLHFRHAVTR